MTTSYNTPDGSGHREVKAIQVSQDAAFFTSAAGDLREAVDGDTGTNIGIPASTDVTNHWLRFLFESPVIIDEVTIYIPYPRDSGTWQWQGSNNGTSWTNLGSSFDPNTSPTQIISLSGNTTGYTYYQMEGKSGTTHFLGNNINEVTFKIDWASPPPLTAYANPGGEGDRRSIITMLAAAGVAGDGSSFIDGSLDSGAWFTAGTADCYLIFDFGTPKI